MRILLDTNVILDVWLARVPFWPDAARLLDTVEQGLHTGILAPTTVTTLHYLVKKHRGEAAARRLLEKLLGMCEVGPLSRVEITSALESKVRDFEDAVIEAVAVAAQAERIATRNLSDFKRAKVLAVEPADLVHAGS